MPNFNKRSSPNDLRVISFFVNLGIPGNDIANSWILSHPENILVPWGSLERRQILKDVKYSKT
jgi:hypothetical protein